MRANLEDRHPNRIDVRVLGGKLLRKLPGEPELISVQQLWCHPPNCALPLAGNSRSTTHRFVDNRGKSKVRQACAALGIYQDVKLEESFSVVISCMVNQELTPFRSPWTMLCSWRYSNPVTTPTSYPNNQCNRAVSLPLNSRDPPDCNPCSS